MNIPKPVASKSKIVGLVAMSTFSYTDCTVGAGIEEISMSSVKLHPDK